MATVLTQDAVLHFIRSSGGSVKNSDLLAHFKSFIRDNADRDRNRELFKRFVNSVATVRQEDGVSLVVLRKQFRGGGGPANPPQGSAGRVAEAPPQRTDPVLTAHKPRPKPQPAQSGTHAPAGETDLRTVLPAAGITINNNNNNNVEASLNAKQLNPITDRTQTSSLSERPFQDQRPNKQGTGLGPLHGVTPVNPVVRPHGEIRARVPVVPVVTEDPPVRPYGDIRARVPVVPVVTEDPPVRPYGDIRARVPVVPVVTEDPPVRPYGDIRARVPVVPEVPPVRPYGEITARVPVIPVATEVPEVRPHGEIRARVPVIPVATEVPEVRPHGEIRPRVPVVSEVPPVRPYGETTVRFPVVPPVRPFEEIKARVPVLPEVPPVRPYGETTVRVPVIPVATEVPPVRPYGETTARFPLVPEVPPERPFEETTARVPVIPVATEVPPVRPYGETTAQFPVIPVATEVPPVRPFEETTAQVPSVPVPVIPVEPVVSVPPTHRGRLGRVQSEGGLLSDAEVAPRRFKYRQSYKSAMSCDDEEEEEEELPLRQRSGGAVWPVSGALTDTARTISTSSPCILDRPAPPPVSSTPSQKQMPKIFIQDVEWDETLVPESLSSSEPGPEPVSGASASRRRASEAKRCRPSPKPTSHQEVQAPVQVQAPVEPRVQPWCGRSSSSSMPDAEFSTDWPPSSSSQGRTDKTAQTRQVPQIQDVLQRAQSATLEPVEHPASSRTAASPRQQSAGGLHDDQESAARVLRRSTAEAEQVPQIQDLLQRAQASKSEPVTRNMEASAWHWSAAHDQDVLHRSTGDLLDTRDEVESSDGSASTPNLRHQLALPRGLSRQVRDRMCRSLGTDLDQIQDDVVGGSEAARLNRLHLISSSLSLRGDFSSSLSSCSTPPRCHSLAELDEGAGPKEGRRSLPASAAPSANHQEAHVRQALTPLEPREHSWYVKAAAGAWPDIYSLFREDHSLLNKQDFISGFTVLHWIAKHGDHRVLNTLWYGVQKTGSTFKVNARSQGGYTPLHIAAIHGNKNIARLLVKNFGADVKLRDTAGKRPWQYLGRAATPDVFQLLGAPARAALQGTGISDLQQPPAAPGRRRRHHLSTASSGERPSIVAGAPKVKRSTSLAAFLKHKSLLPFHGQQSDSMV